MGILDDAIREHLELKRKHGVPEDEVERQEEEALGPARREVAQQAEDAEIAADAGDDTSLFDGDGDGVAPGPEGLAGQGDETAIARPPAVEHPTPVEEPSAPSEQSLEAAEVPAAEPFRRSPRSRRRPPRTTRAWSRRRGAAWPRSRPRRRRRPAACS